ncbi:MAG: hypothetical protein Q4D87_08990 [Actinomycetaceae bacterium]|nr:hypothetical protein [Actinomycetaceae bacterium]
MAGIDATRVLVGAPEQSGASGAIEAAPLGTTLPASAVDTLAEAFVSSGYVSTAGVTVTPDMSTTDITDWSGATVRTMLENFKGSVAFSFIQMDGDSARMIFGDNNVTVTNATAEHGEQIAIAMGPQLPDPKSFVFKMKDGDNLIRIVLPNAQPTSWDEMTFNKTEAIPLGCTLSCYPDENNKSIYIYVDNGVKAGV